ncbi:650_t:CDS:2, partial [Funneliformis geosporum]
TTVTHTIKDLMHTIKYPSDDKLRNAIKIALDNDHTEKMQQYFRVKNTLSSPVELCKWKLEENTKWCLNNLDIKIRNSGLMYIDTITDRVFKQKANDNNRAFVRAVCHCVLNSEYEGIKLDEDYIEDLMNNYL